MRSLAPVSLLSLVVIACSSAPPRRDLGPYGQPYPAGYGPPQGQYLPGHHAQGHGYFPGYGAPPHAQGYPPGHGPPPQVQGQPPAHGHQAPSAAPSAGSTQLLLAGGVAPAPTPPVPAAAPPEVEVCLSREAKKSDCKVALERAALPGPVDNLKYALLYKRACDIKTPLLGCGAFKSTAVAEADNEAMVSLMRCEMGATESCEGLQTQSAPLKAWLTTLKTGWCKKGENALCQSYKECKQPAHWSCEAIGTPPPGSAQEATQACGCVPRCQSGVALAATGKTWPDGTQRAKFSCHAP